MSRTKMNEARQNDLIWLRPEPNKRRPGLSREQITQTAIRIADTEGFEAVTMKRIATELDSGTMTLYYYVRTKADIVALMQDAILADILIPDDELPTYWRDAVTAIARRTRDVLLAHPWSLSALNDAQFGPNAMHHIEQSLAALDNLDPGLDLNIDLATSEKLSLWAIVDDYVFGSALHTHESLSRAAEARRNPRLVADAIAFGQQQLETGQFPRLAALYQRSTSDHSESDHSTPADDAGTTSPPMTTDRLAAQFEHGLNALLEGLVDGLAAPANEGARSSRRNVRSPQGPATKNPRAD
jgi:AcrR family transcriptional regulator